MKRSILILFLLGLPVFLWAQNSCAEALAKAYTDFEEGLYDRVIENLERNLKACNYSSDEEKQIYKLLSAAFYAADELEKASEYMVLFLKEEPNYKVNKGIDPYQFTEAFHKYAISPKWSVSLAMSISKFYIEREKVYSVYDGADYTKQYESIHHVFPSLWVEWRTKKNFSLNLVVDFSEILFDRTIPNGDNIVLQTKEESEVASLGLLVGYDIKMGQRIFPTVYFGVLGAHLVNPILSATTTVSIYNEAADSYAETKRESHDNALDLQRNMQNWALTAGIRLNYKYKSFVFFGEVRYAHFMRPYTNGKKYELSKLMYDHYYIDDDLKINNSQISFGASYIFSNHIKFKY